MRAQGRSDPGLGLGLTSSPRPQNPSTCSRYNLACHRQVERSFPEPDPARLGWGPGASRKGSSVRWKGSCAPKPQNTTPRPGQGTLQCFRGVGGTPAATCRPALVTVRWPSVLWRVSASGDKRHLDGGHLPPPASTFGGKGWEGGCWGPRARGVRPHCRRLNAGLGSTEGTENVCAQRRRWQGEQGGFSSCQTCLLCPPQAPDPTPPPPRTGLRRRGPVRGDPKNHVPFGAPDRLAPHGSRMGERPPPAFASGVLRQADPDPRSLCRAPSSISGSGQTQPQAARLPPPGSCPRDAPLKPRALTQNPRLGPRRRELEPPGVPLSEKAAGGWSWASDVASAHRVGHPASWASTAHGRPPLELGAQGDLGGLTGAGEGRDICGGDSPVACRAGRAAVRSSGTAQGWGLKRPEFLRF